MNFKRAPEGHYFATGDNFYYEIHNGQQFWKVYCRRGTHNPLKMIGGYGTKRQCIERARGYDASL